jgi:hypothetical protein
MVKSRSRKKVRELVGEVRRRRSTQQQVVASF